MAGLLILLPGTSTLAGPAVDPAPEDPVALDQRDRAVDKAHLLKIYDAIQAYRKQKGELPGWLSDLFPDFLSDTSLLVSPAEARRGPAQTWGYQDLKLRCSYIYEFSQATAGGRRDRDIQLTMRQWKELQMEEFGPAIPLLRCHIYDQVLNVSYSGHYYETALFWEQDANTFALMQQVGPGPGAKDGRKLEVTALDADTGKPLAECQVLVTNRTSELGPLPPRLLQTGSDGKCVVNLGGRNPTATTLRVFKRGHASVGMQWSQGDPRFAWTARMSPAVLIGGVVRSVSGQPVGGVRVSISGIAQDVVGQTVPVDYDAAVTDSTGHWSSASVPKTLGTLTFRLAHEEYLPTEIDVTEGETAEGSTVTARDLLARQAEMRLEPGFAVQGRATRADGQPVAGARVVVATGENLENRKTRPTDVDGRFRIVMTEVADGQILIQARGFVPEQRAIVVDREIKPLNIELSPSRLIRGRVLDGEKQPVAGATVQLTTMGRSSLLDWRAVTDAEGRFTCDGVPSGGGFGLYATKEGYGMPVFQEINAATEGEVLLRLERSFTLTGRVTDADTGQPLKEFHVIPGRVWGVGDEEANPVQWETYRQQRGAAGSYTLPFEDQDGGHYRVLVVADGYLPAMTPLMSGRGQRTNNFALKKGKGPEGVVVNPSGQPVEGAQVATVGFGYVALGRATIESNDQEATGVVTTDAQGQFRLPAILVAPTIVAVHESGYAEVNATNLAASGKMVLQKWGRIEGVMKFGSRPAADAEVVLNPVGAGRVQLNYSHDQFKTQTDQDGRFRFDTVPPGEQQLARLIRMGERSWTYSQAQNLTIKSGEVTEVLLGGTGRAVTGQFVLSDPSREVDWNQGHRSFNTRMPQPPKAPQSQEEWQAWQSAPEFREAIKQMRHYSFQIEPDGSFRIEGVQAGHYTLRIHLTEAGGSGFGGGMPIASLGRDVVMPEIPGGTSDEPLDLGEIPLQTRVPLAVGRPAPPFEAQSLDDKRITLNDYRGKVLLLCFWVPQAWDLDAGLSQLKQLAQKHAQNARFALLSLALIESRDDTAACVKKHELPGVQAYMGNRSQVRTMQSYVLGPLPSYCLIGPDGKLLAKDLDAADLESTVAKALK